MAPEAGAMVTVCDLSLLPQVSLEWVWLMSAVLWPSHVQLSNK